MMTATGRHDKGLSINREKLALHRPSARRAMIINNYKTSSEASP
ncbi:hypothetical protein [Aliamphritea hakodatensis]|nr:hypothetical protein [Aliamphritea hakodatensis]